MKGLYTIESIQKKRNITRQSAINLISRLRKQNKVITTGGGKQIRFYKISDKPMKKENGMYQLIKKYTPININPYFNHYVKGKSLSFEQVIIDCLNINDSRHQLVVLFLLNHVKDWKKLKDKVNNSLLLKIYNLARKTTKTRKMPTYIYNSLKKSKKQAKMLINENDVLSAKGEFNDKS